MKLACMAGYFQSQHANCAYRTFTSESYGTKNADVVQASAFCVAAGDFHLPLRACPVAPANIWSICPIGR